MTVDAIRAVHLHQGKGKSCAAAGWLTHRNSLTELRVLGWVPSPLPAPPGSCGSQGPPSPCWGLTLRAALQITMTLHKNEIKRGKGGGPGLANCRDEDALAYGWAGQPTVNHKSFSTSVTSGDKQRPCKEGCSRQGTGDSAHRPWFSWEAGAGQDGAAGELFQFYCLKKPQSIG